jgi:hypothetical protein
MMALDDSVVVLVIRANENYHHSACIYEAVPADWQMDWSGE